MNLLVFIDNILKYFLLTFSTLYTTARILNYSNITHKQIIIATISCMILGVLYAYLIIFIPSFSTIIILILAISLLITFITNYKIEHVIIVVFVAITINFICFMIAIFVTCVFTELPFIKINSKNPIVIIIASSLHILLIYKLFKIKRFKKGFSFLKDENNVNNFSIILLILCGNLIILYSFLGNNKNFFLAITCILGCVSISIGTYICIKRNITLDYQDHMKNRKIELLESDLQSAQEKNKELTNEIQNLTMINHKYSSRIKAAEQEIKKLAYIYSSTNNTEISTELSDITKLVQNLSKEYTNELSSNLAYCPTLPKTNVLGVDILFEHLQTEAIKNNINYDNRSR